MISVIPYTDLNLGKKEQVKRMFNNIAGRYDFMNRLLTMRIDILWRRKAVSMVKDYAHDTILDIGTGTGDFAIEIANQLSVVSGQWSVVSNQQQLTTDHLPLITGIDIAEKMLEIGREKIKQKGLSGKIELKEADCENLPFPDNTYNLATSAFGVRNFENLDKGLSEMYRVLKPGGRVLILEASEPVPVPKAFGVGIIFKKLYTAYMTKICPAVGGVFSENKAYNYLNRSVAAFPSGVKFMEELKKTGFINTLHKPLSLGVVSVYIAQKPETGK